MVKFNNAKVGDRVWHIIHGLGEIVHINKDENIWHNGEIYCSRW